MNAIEFINNHNKVIFWNVYRFNEENAEWDLIDRAEIEDHEQIEESFFSKSLEENDTCDLYLA